MAWWWRAGPKRVGMHYEINISKNGQHFFATHERSIHDQRKLAEVYVELRRAFPANKGYEITVTAEVRSGRNVDMTAVISDIKECDNGDGDEDTDTN